MKDPVIAPVALLIACLLWVPWPQHWGLRNVPILFLIFWLFIGNLVLGINTAIWWNNVDRKGDPWCDISIRLTSMAIIGSQTATMELSRKLLRISRANTASESGEDKRRRQIIEATICLAVPVLHATLALTYQGHRYDLVEGVGCTGPFYKSWEYGVFSLAPPLLISLATLLMSGVAGFNFIKRRLQLSSVLQGSSSSLSRGRFLRLLSLAFAEAIYGFPVTLTVDVITIVGNTKQGLWREDASWKTIHVGFDKVQKFPASIWDHRRFDWSLFELSRWVLPVGGIIFLILFATTEDCRAHYRGIFPARRSGQDNGRPPFDTELQSRSLSSQHSSSPGKAHDDDFLYQPHSSRLSMDIHVEKTVQVFSTV